MPVSRALRRLVRLVLVGVPALGLWWLLTSVVDSSTPIHGRTSRYCACRSCANWPTWTAELASAFANSIFTSAEDSRLAS